MFFFPLAFYIFPFFFLSLSLSTSFPALFRHLVYDIVLLISYICLTLVGRFPGSRIGSRHILLIPRIVPFYIRPSCNRAVACHLFLFECYRHRSGKGNWTGYM